MTCLQVCVPRAFVYSSGSEGLLLRGHFLTGDKREPHWREFQDAWQKQLFRMRPTNSTGSQWQSTRKLGMASKNFMSQHGSFIHLTSMITHGPCMATGHDITLAAVAYTWVEGVGDIGGVRYSTTFVTFKTNHRTSTLSEGGLLHRFYLTRQENRQFILDRLRFQMSKTKQSWILSKLSAPWHGPNTIVVLSIS